MRHPRPGLLIVASCVIVLVGLPFFSLGHASQDIEKSLEIERHANEPLELVDLKISDLSVKNKIKVKFRKDDDGLDNVKFRDVDDWPKRVRVRLRNVSGRTITGFQAYLYLKPPGWQVLFSVSLKGSSRLEHTSLGPGDEIETTVDDGSWDRTVSRLKQSGADANLASVTLAVELVAFADGLQWHRGHTLRVDPANPNRVMK